MASALVHAFPCLKDTTGSGSETWYAQGRNHHPATGSLEERLRNIRKRLRSMSRPQREEVDEPYRTFIPDAKGEIALRLLPIMLPPPVFRVGRKVVRPSVDEARQALIDLRPVGTNMVEYLQQAEVSRPYPYVLSLGDEHQAFVPGISHPTRTGLRAKHTAWGS
ncbi:hypothetical protein SKAU_G00405270 [Synaphobranchus kaupii]|uniref:Uncharacterized protein n=1 Tax=Synaphobranchus kaupii TaxID=118154 RepID=A0A9Q1IAS2_SYNKA|nr:hypothetical protein SKAU_G00405270 [Synaphobranchus kaupii]